MYKPRKSDIDWLRALIEALNNQGCWIIPALGGQYYQFNKVKKIAYFHGDRGHQIAKRTKSILTKYLGWKCVEIDNPSNGRINPKRLKTGRMEQTC